MLFPNTERRSFIFVEVKRGTDHQAGARSRYDPLANMSISAKLLNSQCRNSKSVPHTEQNATPLALRTADHISIQVVTGALSPCLGEQLQYPTVDLSVACAIKVGGKFGWGRKARRLLLQVRYAPLIRSFVFV